jgi:hypothetical protein
MNTAQDKLGTLKVHSAAYTYKELEQIFINGFILGFNEGKTRNIITKKYFDDCLNTALNQWKTKNNIKDEDTKD